MEGMLSSRNQQRGLVKALSQKQKKKQRGLVSSFLEIVVGQTEGTARQFLEATNWKLDEAIQLSSATHSRPASDDFMAAQSWGAASYSGYERMRNDVDEVRAPLPVVRQTLYGDSMYYKDRMMKYSQREQAFLMASLDFSEVPKSHGVWEPEEGASSASASASAPETTSAPKDSLASLYRPPYHLMLNGSFEQAKSTSSSQDKWLLVNVQSTTEFSSHTLNRDTWANESVSQTIKASFTFWQVNDDTIEGKKVCTYYNLESAPVVLVIDPTTGQKMRMWCGMVEPGTLLENLVPFLDGGPQELFASLSKKRPRGNFSLTPHSKPKDHVVKDEEEEEELQRALAASLELKDTKEVAVTTTVLPTYPPLPEEPKGGDHSVQCRVGIRLPNGQRLQRNFLKTDSIQLLWSFCYSQLEESERKKPLKLTQAIPGESKTLEYESNLTLEQSGVANSMISATWE